MSFLSTLLRRPSRVSARHLKPRRFRPTLDSLEDRLVPTTFSWTWVGSIASDDWAVASNWSGGTGSGRSVPNSKDDLITLTGVPSQAPDIRAGEVVTVGSIVTNASYSGGLTVAGQLTIDGTDGFATQWNATAANTIILKASGAAAGDGKVFLTNGTQVTVATGGINDGATGSTKVPQISIQNGSALYINGGTGNLQAAFTIDGADASGRNSALVLGHDLATNALMLSRDSITIQNGGELVFYGGNGAGSVGGIDLVPGQTRGTGDIPITMSGTNSRIYCLNTDTNGEKISLQAFITLHSGNIGIAQNDSMLFPNNTAHPWPVANAATDGGFIILLNGSTLHANVDMEGGGAIQEGGTFTENRVPMTYTDTGFSAATIDGAVTLPQGNIDLSKIPSPGPGKTTYTDKLTITGSLAMGNAAVANELLIVVDPVNPGVCSQLVVNGTSANIRQWDGTHGVRVNVADPGGLQAQNNGQVWIFFQYGAGTTLTGGFLNSQSPPYDGTPTNTYTLLDDTAGHDQQLVMNDAIPLARKHK
jgi:hypothetical protein